MLLPGACRTPCRAVYPRCYRRSCRFRYMPAVRCLRAVLPALITGLTDTCPGTCRFCVWLRHPPPDLTDAAPVNGAFTLRLGCTGLYGDCWRSITGFGLYSVCGYFVADTFAVPNILWTAPPTPRVVTPPHTHLPTPGSATTPTAHPVAFWDMDWTQQFPHRHFAPHTTGCDNRGCGF